MESERVKNVVAYKRLFGKCLERLDDYGRKSNENCRSMFKGNE